MADKMHKKCFIAFYKKNETSPAGDSAQSEIRVVPNALHHE